MLKDMSEKKTKQKAHEIQGNASTWSFSMKTTAECAGSTRKKYPEITKGSGKLEMKSSDGKYNLLSVPKIYIDYFHYIVNHGIDLE